MPVAEIFLSAFISVLFEKLASGELLNLARREGIHTQLKTWSKTLLKIQTVLSDAEEKQITDQSVQMWLDELQDLAYDLDDILDDLATEALRRKFVSEPQASTSKVRKIIPTCCTSFTPRAVKFDLRMKSKIDEITTRLQDLEKQKDFLSLRENVGGISSNKTEERLTTTSLVDESRVYGRKNDEQAILELLLGCEPCDDETRVIPIVGMGGLGKTTLAGLVYNNEKVKNCFDIKAWVCVLDVFDVFMITKIIYDSVTGESREFKDLNSVQVSLKEKLSNKKFLLVLDDVWNENYGKWDLLRTPFRVGAPGSTIIVTTRNESVASIMRSGIPPYHLGHLVDGDCLSILAQHALVPPNFDAHQNLKEIGEEIAKKCKGLPLAAKALGGLLRSKESPNEWNDVLNSKIWDLPKQSDDILPALRLSYHHLPFHLKRLFAYCSIFPADYEFDKYELVLLWMGEGFLKQTGEQKKKMEEVGFDYFNELLSRSFFQRSSGGQSHFLMHDLTNDLAKFVAGGLCFRLDDKMVSNERYTVFEKARHSSFIRREFEVFERFDAFIKVRGLRTFLPLPVYKLQNWENFYLTNRVLHDLLPKLRCLRVLSFSGYCIIELPNSIGDLKHLRYLNLSATRIKQLPESVGNLYNLQTLILRRCRRLTKLPSSIENLINLRHLDIAGTNELQEMPLGIGKLTSLQTLSKLILSQGNGLGVMALRGLSDLHGSLSIIGLHNVRNVQDARDANLLCKQGLDKLALIWSTELDDSRNGSLENEVLDVLKPYTNLRKLKIAFYGGTEFSSWVGNPSFSNIAYLTLTGCKQCTNLPSLGQLPLLKELFIKDMDGVKSVGVEFCGASFAQVVTFPLLETLEFVNMLGWEEWSANLASDIEENAGGVFPCLRNLRICGCPKLIKVSLPRLPSLRELDISGCCEVVLRSMVGIGSVTVLSIRNISGLTQLDEGITRFLGELKSLDIKECNELMYLWQEEDALLNLKLMSLSDCRNLEKMPNLRNSLTSLRNLFIWDCQRLDSFPATTYVDSNNNDHLESSSHLERLHIWNCSSLMSFPTGQKLPPTLKELLVSNCTNLETGSENIWLLNGVSSLEDICILGSANLKSLPGCLLSFVHLTCLAIGSCPGLESFSESGLPPNLTYFEISKCENLKSLPDDQMQSLKSLSILTVEECPSLESFPRGRWPPNITSFSLGDLKQPFSEWGLRSLPTSLVNLRITGHLPEFVFFSDVCALPTTLTSLAIQNSVNLESLSMGLQNLTSLEDLWIGDCPKLRSLPETLFPKLLRLRIFNCQLLEQRCLKQKRDYWPKIADIPCVEIGGVLLDEL